MLRKPKTGRRASESERLAALEWVKLYRLAEASHDGCHCLNPEDEPECQTFIDVTNIEPLLRALEEFGKYGTFEFVDSTGIKRMLLRDELKRIRAGGKTYEFAIEEMAKKHNCSVSTMERAVRSTANRGTD
ncbi:MAG: hypothetical protein IPN53_17460 [Comamonadaceae bacterium]|nr:hypothetical protein [Comamonadaceae bacterium]